MNSAANIVLADDHQLVIDGLRLLLSSRPEWIIQGEARNGAELLDLLKSTPCDLVITDLSMPGMRGIDLIQNIKTNIAVILKQVFVIIGSVIYRNNTVTLDVYNFI